MLSLSFILLSSTNSNKQEVEAAPDMGDSFIYVYAYYDATILTSKFSASYDGGSISSGTNDKLSTEGYYCVFTYDKSFPSSALLIVTAAPTGYAWKNKDTGDIYDNSTINENVSPIVTTSTVGYSSSEIYTINIELVKYDKPTLVQITIKTEVTGDNASGVFVYILTGSGEITQFALVGNGNTELSQTIGETITILVSKPYMWSMEITGASGTQNGTKYTYTVPSTASTITIKLSGGGSITNNTIVI